MPAGRIKAGKEHRVPLVAAALALLGERGGPDELVFGSEQKLGRALSDMSLSAVLRRMGRDDLTVHGFRSTFRDWAGEATAHPRETIEAALAHRLKDKAEAAYARGDLFVKRRRLMDDWARFCTQPPAEGAVVPMARAHGSGDGVRETMLERAPAEGWRLLRRRAAVEPGTVESRPSARA